MRTTPRHTGPPPQTRPAPRGRLKLWQLLDMLEETGAIDAVTKKDLLAREETLKAKFLRNKFGSGGTKRNYPVSATEMVDAAKLPHPEAPGRFIDEDILARLLAQATNLPYKKIDPLDLDRRLVTKTVSAKFAKRHVMLPIHEEGNKLIIALADPFDTAALEEFSRASGRTVEVVVTAKKDIVNILSEVHGFQKAVAGASQDASTRSIQNLEGLVRVRANEEIDPEDQNIVAAVEYLLNNAFDNRASDIHIEPKREVSKLRLRIDGILHDVGEIPAAVHPAFVARIKILARMDIAEKRRPQDGRIKTQRGEGEIELRVSSLPVAFGEKVVIRIFDPQVLLAEVKDLGFSQRERDIYEDWITRPNGLVLVTGPTGSGKTTTLYSTLKYLARPGVNVVTVEDPIEMVYEPLNQVAVQSKIEVTFASALRTILRQDPDVIMVGEIRDHETALMTVQAALTGHLVFSTLHTNDTASSVSRMIDLDVEPFLLGSTLAGVIAQRLVRKVCTECADQRYLTEDQIHALGINVEPGSTRRLPVKEGAGCVRCRHTGLFGRTGIFEILDVTTKIRRMIAEQKDAKEIAKAAELDGMVSLRKAAIKKLAQGVTTYEEVFRVTADSEL